MNTLHKFIILSALGTFFLCDPYAASAGKVKPLSLDSITKSAEHIFEGKCVAIETGRDEESGMIATWYTFKVLRGIQGEYNDTFTFKQLGGAGPKHVMKVPITTYKEDEHLILFLYPKSEIGFTSSVGMHQGKFQIKEMEKSGIQYVTNGMPGTTLFAEMASNPAAVTAKGLSTSGMEVYKSNRFEKEEFVNLVEQLVEQNKRKTQ